MLFSLKKKKSKHTQSNDFYIYTFSLFSIVLAGMTLFQVGVIADETGNAGDPLSFYLFIAVVSINIMNMVLHLYKKYVPIKNHKSC